MQDLARGGTIEVLEYLHRKLDAHFEHLWEQRQRLDPAPPVFALEHALPPADLDLLRTAVRDAVRQGFGAQARQWWLPFVVYAAEVGYDYVGNEYWPSFEAATPTWAVHGDRQRIKAWFMRFANQYGGAVPTGAWAETFTIICWPITHAVLPTYLQRQLAQLLFEYRTGLTTALLSDPAVLGARLASRSGGFTDRFRIFCQNTTLLGQVAAALLSGDDEDSPYLLGATLHRLVDGLSRERQSHLWLRDAKRSASSVRSSGFRTQGSASASGQRAERLPAATDPKLFLRRERGGGWRAYVALPDLSTLQARLPHVYDELRTSRARVAGVDGKPLAKGRLAYAGQEVPFTSWPRTDEPFLQLERASAEVNALIADQCVMNPGPWWLFRVRPGGPAVEVKGTFVRPGRSYCLVGHAGTEVPSLPWITETTIHAEGARAFELSVPAVLGDGEDSDLIAAGIGVLADVAVRPVGLVASAWDGEGAVEWLAGEHALIGIRAERAPDRCVVTVDDQPYVVPWHVQGPELFLALDGLAVGSHDVTVTLMVGGDDPLAAGSLRVMIRDPQVRLDTATAGEGIRLFASPARPTLSELWDDRAVLSIEGPSHATANLSLALRSADTRELVRISRSVDLPMRDDAWRDFARRELRGQELRGCYDEAESCEVTVSRAGIGFASLLCERGFQPLRWVLTRQDRRPIARLIDRTDGDPPQVEFFSVESPLIGEGRSAEAVIEFPPRGGLLRATARGGVASIILPPNPNQLFAEGNVRPMVQVGPKVPREVMRLIARHREWLEADLPADPFAKHQQELVLGTITREMVSLIAGAKWSHLERTLEHHDAFDRLEEMQTLVGEAPPQRALAKRISEHLWQWAGPAASLEEGFADAVANVARNAGVEDVDSAARFLLVLTNRPGYLEDWEPLQRDILLDVVMRSPVLVRAARFAVLGTEAFSSDLVGSSAAVGRR